jgi:toluene monooxygenase electron transfer component
MMTLVDHEIRLSGSDIVFKTAKGDNLLRAALRAGIGFPYECNVGVCGSCKFEVLDGEVFDLWPEAPGLSAKDRAKGRRLACQCRPLTSCEIKARCSKEFEPVIRPYLFSAELVGRQMVTHDIFEFSFRSHEDANFLPGQYLLLSVPNGDQVRAYSMSNLSNTDGLWNVMVRRVPNGIMSNWLFDSLKLGEFINVDGPYGLAYLRSNSAHDVVCIAGGSGLAPMLSIANSASMASTMFGRSISLFYGGRTVIDIPKFDELLLRPASVACHVAVSTPESEDHSGWVGNRGFVHELMAQTLNGDLSDREYYLAGPPPMIETVVRTLMLEHKVPANQIHFDRFF